MISRDVLDKLRHARSAHVGWVNRARALIDGKPVDKEKVPVLSTECVFGKWYYSDGQRLAKLATFKAVEPAHDRLHEIYAEIFNLLFSEEKGSFISRLTGRYEKEREERQTRARKLFKELQKISDTIVQQLDALERDIRILMEQDDAWQMDRMILEINGERIG